MTGKRLNFKLLQPGEAFKFEYCAIREFMIAPQNGKEPFSYDLKIYNDTIRLSDLVLQDGGLNDYIQSCPEKPDGFIEVTCVTGPIVVFHKN